MEKLWNQMIKFCIVFVLLFTSFKYLATAQEVEDTSTFDYIGSLRGPEQWGTLREDWRVCSNGTMQSPIDLLDGHVRILSPFGPIQRAYLPANATLKNRGHDMMLTWQYGGAGHVEVNGIHYVLKQCHWHSPAEHTINGVRYDLELHLVHQSLSGQILVIGVSYQINFTHADTFLALLRPHLLAIVSNTTATQDRTIVGIFDPNKIRIGTRSYYKYIGSLTVPPCTQNVLWLVSTRVRPVSSRQVNLLRVAVNDGYEFNARPVQDMLGRPLHYANEDIRNELELQL